MHSKSEKPWIKTKGYGIIKAVDGKKEQKTTPTAKTTIIKLDLDDGVKVNYRKVQTASDGKFYEILADSKNIKAKEK
ncbi:hypothetical protein DW967_17495 [Agathobacter rectalis]|uniref:Uncharacterized protein n=1 Tax=Agathobacter rectalis TaxID=39491 RepID=A0A413Q2C7_9FIRM|nr:hypothetical protein DW967_17495 [Agathobacter rectalis]